MASGGGVWVVCLLLGCLSATAAWSVDERRLDQSWDAVPGVRVHLEVPAGRLQVIGWERSEVRLQGQAAPGVGPLRASADGHKVHLALTAEEGADGADREVQVTVHVPRRSRLFVQGFAAAVEVREMTGYVEVESLGGSLDIAGRPDEVRTRTLTGQQSLNVESRRLVVRSLQGAVQISGQVALIEASSVSGDLNVDARLAGEMKLLSTSGRISFSGEVLPSGRLTVETTSGTVDLQLAEDADAVVDLTTRSDSVSTPSPSTMVPRTVPSEAAFSAAESADTVPPDAVRQRLVFGRASAADGDPERAHIRVVSRAGDVRLDRPSSP